MKLPEQSHFLICQNCGAENFEKFCSQCGEPLQPVKKPKQPLDQSEPSHSGGGEQSLDQPKPSLNDETEFFWEDKKIEVKGRIQIGSELRLIRVLTRDDETGNNIIRARQPVRVYTPERSSFGQETRRKYGVDLEPKKEGQIYFKDQGLSQSYGVFGVPGCGKTYFLKHILKQLVRHESGNKELKFGGLILDPKSALLGDIYNVFKKAGRENDLIIINETYLRQTHSDVNVIDCFLDPFDLGKALAMAAQSAGISSKEPFWLNELGAIFGAGLFVLQLLSKDWEYKPVLKEMALMMLDSGDPPLLELALRNTEKLRPKMTQSEIEEFDISKNLLQNYLRPSENNQTLSSFIYQAFGSFQRPKYGVFSKEIALSPKVSSLYDSTIEDGKVILVSVSKRSLEISKILCTLIKCLYQQTVLTRLDRNNSGELKNFNRPLLFMADEYSDVATKLPGQPMGDSLFFSQMRQFGCMGLVATQSIHMLEHSGLEKAWKAIYANMAAKIFMQCGDHETADEASKLVGESEFRFETIDRTISKDGSSLNNKVDLKDKRDLPTNLLLQALERGEAVVVGQTDGISAPSSWFVKIQGQHWNPDQPMN